MKNVKKVLAVVLAAIIACLAFVGCQKAVDNKEDASKAPEVETVKDLDKVKEKGTLVIGITEFEPVDYKDENGEYIGYDADLANKFAESLGVKAEFKVIEWDNKFLELQTGAIDCIWNGMTITDEVKLNTSNTDAYAKNEQVVVINKDLASKYTTMESLKELKFAVENGSAAQGACDDNGLNYVAVTAQADALLEVKAGSTDAAIIDSTMAKKMTGEGTTYENLAVAMVVTKEEYGVGFRKGSDLTEKANEFISQCKADGTLKGLSATYGIAAAE